MNIIKHPNGSYTNEDNDTLITDDAVIASSTVIEYVDSQACKDKLGGEERVWRDIELSKADIEINKAEDVAGVFDATDWRDYRQALRDWPEHVDFPDQTKRPISP